GRRRGPRPAGAATTSGVPAVIAMKPDRNMRRGESKMRSRLAACVVAMGGLSLAAQRADAQAVQAPIFLSQIESFELEPGCASDFCAASMVIGGQRVTLPANLLIDLPANRLSARQIFDQAPPACR